MMIRIRIRRRKRRSVYHELVRDITGELSRLLLRAFRCTVYKVGYGERRFILKYLKVK
jgi:hypothetical protein